MGDPYLAQSGAQNVVRTDVQEFSQNVSSLYTRDQYVGGAAKPSRFLWRPPRPWQLVSGGDVHYDTRGRFGKIFAFKIRLENKLNAPINVVFNTPFAEISDPTTPYKRTCMHNIELAPKGSVKATTKGKGKNARTFDRKTDQYSFYISEKREFTGDANKYRFMEELIPGDKVDDPSYNAIGLVMGDMIIYTPNENQYTGGVYNDNLNAVTIHISAKYQASTEKPPPGTTEEQVLQFCLSELNGVQDMFYTKPELDLSGAVVNTRFADPVVMTQFPVSAYPNIGVAKDPQTNDNIYLAHYRQGVVVDHFTHVQWQDPDLRLVIPGLSIVETPETTGGFRTGLRGVEFGWIESKGGFYAVDVDGQPTSFPGVGINHPYPMSARATVIVYDIRRPTLREHQDALTEQQLMAGKSVSFKSIFRGISKIVSVVTTIGKAAEYIGTLVL